MKFLLYLTSAIFLVGIGFGIGGVTMRDRIANQFVAQEYNGNKVFTIHEIGFKFYPTQKGFIRRTEVSK